MRKLFSKHIEIAWLKKAENAIGKFSIGESWLFYILATVMIASSLFIINKVNNQFSVTIPSHGGTIAEGIVGSPRFINPLLAISDADRDLSSLVFSGLLRANADGTLAPDLAEKYEISSDGLVYTVTLKKNAQFQDGEPLTVDDVIFTIEKTKDPDIKSPRRAEWDRVTVEKVSENVVSFHLPKPYYPFVENLTLGIIPKNLWKNETVEEFTFSLKNINPIGSGPFKIDKIIKNNKGIPTEYDLVAFSKYASGEPYLKNIKVKLYPNEQDMLNAWRNGDIDSIGGISPSETGSLSDTGANIKLLTLPRVYGVFFNQNQASVFTEKAVRVALDEAVDKDMLLKKVLYGYGSALNGPLPSDTFNLNNAPYSTSDQNASTTTDRIAKAKDILAKAGWALNKETGTLEKKTKTKKSTTVNTLSFSISTPNIPELKEVAEFVSNTWNALGAKTDVKLFELSDLSQNVIRPRKYDALLFGQVIGRNPDLFAFWHSSQRNDPGYNIALYANNTVDKLLNDAREAKNQDDQYNIVKKIYDEINKDVPAIFLYSPDYIYVLPNNIKGFKSGFIASPSERFAGIANWYINESKVWKIFAPKTSTNN